MTLQNIKNEMASVLEKYDVESAGVFGSFARDENDAESDIDLLVQFRSPKTLLEIIALEQELSELTGRKVEVVTKRSLHPYLAPSVYKDLKPLYGK
jgi:predicted nucleotidyltransferase